MNNKELKAETEAQQSKNAELLPSAPLVANPLLAVRCIHSHEDGLTFGKVYDAHKQGEWGYDVFHDDFGILSGWDKRYFEIVKKDIIVQPQVIYYQIDFGNHIRCQIKVTNNKIEVEGAMNGWGDEVQLAEVIIVKLQ